MKVIDIDRSMGIDRWATIETHRGARNIASKRPGCDARVTEKAIHDASIGMAVMDWIDDDATDRGARRRTRASIDRLATDRSIVRVHRVVVIHRSHRRDRGFIHSFDRAIGPSVGRWNGMEWNGMEWMGTTSIPRRHTYRQTIHIYTTIDPSSYITYSARATDRPTRPTTTDATSRARDVTRRRRLPSTLECRRRDAGLERRRRNERTNERTRLSRLGR